MDLSTRAYRLFARAAARRLSSSDMVISVYARRSVASGEVAFGRSDIDLGIVVPSGVSPSRERHDLLKLAEVYRRVKVGLPMLGECAVHDRDSLRQLARIDPYRASIDRRAAIVLHGPAFEVPVAAVPGSESVRRLIFWIERYLPVAIRSRNTRNLKKFALEMWNGWACATGLVAEPFLTRRETAAALEQSGMQLPQDPVARCFHIAADMHRRLLSPMDRPRSVLASPIQLPPTLEPRLLVVIPDGDHALPPDAFDPMSLVATPEALALYVRYVNPFAYAYLPPSVVDLGVLPPDRTAVASCCRRYAGDRQMLRAPGFASTNSAAPSLRTSAARLGLDALRNDESPGRLPDRVSAAAPTVTDYYMNIYPALCDEMSQIWKGLEEIDEPGAHRLESTMSRRADSSVTAMEPQS